MPHNGMLYQKASNPVNLVQYTLFIGQKQGNYRSYYKIHFGMRRTHNNNATFIAPTKPNT